MRMLWKISTLTLGSLRALFVASFNGNNVINITPQNSIDLFYNIILEMQNTGIPDFQQVKSWL